jgi:outer membrane protein insertion porin family
MIKKMRSLMTSLQRYVFICMAAALAFTLVTIPAASSFGQSGPPVIADVRVIVADAPDKAIKWKDIARSLIQFKPGDAYADLKLRDSLAALDQSGLFEKIHFPDPDLTLPEITLEFYVTPYSRIKDIRITGGFPLLEKEIRNVMSIYTGDVYVPARLPEQSGFIAGLFEKEGYIAPAITLDAEKDASDGHVIIHVLIKNGPFLKISSVTLTGNRSFSQIRLRTRLSTWHASLLPGEASRFVKKDLDQDVITLRDFYRAKGFYDVVIENDVKTDTASKTVDIRIMINEGPFYRIDIEGNTAFYQFTLKKDLPLAKDGNRNDLGLRKGIRAMKKRYAEDGYPDARISWKADDFDNKGMPERRILFTIEEGPRHIVTQISISGNQALSEDEIRRQILTRTPGWITAGQYNADVLREDLRAIKALYLRNGFLETRIDETVDIKAPDSDAKKKIREIFIQIDIAEGPQTRVGRVDIAHLDAIPMDAARKALTQQPGEPFRRYMVTDDQNTLAALISEAGYPHVTVSHEVDISPDKMRADIIYTVDAGPAVRMGETFVIGNFKTRPHIIDREISLEADAPFSLSRVLSSQRDIRNINALSGARFTTMGLAEKADRVDLLVEVEEKKPYFAEFAVGYDTQRLFYTQAAVGDNNLLGLNKQLRAELEWSQIGYRSEVGLTEPRFFGTRIKSHTALFGEKLEELNKDFGTRTYGASYAFSRELAKNLTGSLNLRFEYREQYRTDSTPIPEEEADQYQPRSILVGTPGLAYNSTDSFIRPTRGIRATGSVDVSSGMKNSLDDFFKYRAEIRAYHTPIRRVTLAVRARFGHIDPYGSRGRIPEDQLFFLGGTTDVRGFSENKLRVDDQGDPVGGQTSLLGSAEIRFDMGMNFELAGFYDTGAIRDVIRNGDSDGFRESAGIGLRYITAIGPIGLMHGWKLDRQPGESRGAFHFSIGYTF